MNRYHHNLLDQDFDPVKNYFFKEIKAEKFNEIGIFFEDYFKKGDMNKDALDKYFDAIKNMSRFTKNLENLQQK